MRNRILDAIKNDTFSFAEFFPDSKHVDKTDKPLFMTVADQYLASKKRALAETTFAAYRNVIDNHFLPEFGNKAIADISFLEINNFMSSIDLSNKTYNNILTILKAIFKFAVKASDSTGVTINHALGIDYAKAQEPEPDPLTPAEIEIVLNDMAKYYHETIEIYFSLAFRIGFRPSEGIALQWGDIDWNKKILVISRARVGGIDKGTKTGKSRVVELDDDCIGLLNRLKKHTMMKGEHLFLAQQTGKPWVNTTTLANHYWVSSLKRCKIRYREARQTRHTCATLMLMAGARDRWSAERLGHSVEMFRKVYSKWMPEIDERRELSKLSGMFKKSETLKLVSNEENHG